MLEVLNQSVLLLLILYNKICEECFCRLLECTTRIQEELFLTLELRKNKSLLEM